MTPEDEAFEELDRRLNTKQVAKAMENLNNELEIFRNEVIEEVAAHLEQEFQIPFAQDTLDSFVIYIREMKRPLPNGS
jgi:hypothetical protein